MGISVWALLNRKFHSSQTSHCEDLVPIPHSMWRIGTNTSHISHPYLTLGKNTHEVNFHIAYMRIPHIDNIPRPDFAAFCIRFQFFTVLSLTSMSIKYKFFTSVIICYQFFYMCEDLVPVLHMYEFWYNFFTCDDLIPIFYICYWFFICVRTWYQFFTFVKKWYQFFTFEMNRTSSLHVKM